MNAIKVIEHITAWLSGYNKSSGTKGFVVGVSGGIDSAVTSTLGARTGLPLIVVNMPIHQGADQVLRAQDHVSWLQASWPNVNVTNVELSGVFDGFTSSLPSAEQSKSQDMALVNTRARLRMTTLYYFASLNNYLVLGTGNKVEDFGIGFFTKYGDGGVDVSPIADLVKSEVYQLAHKLSIIESIQKAPPTDGLWGDARTDEDQIGASYPELEVAMEFDGSESELSDRQLEVLTIYRRLNAANKHKMDPIPVCKIPRSLRA